MQPPATSLHAFQLAPHKRKYSTFKLFHTAFKEYNHVFVTFPIPYTHICPLSLEMGSKKQRAKAGKADKDQKEASVKETQLPTPHRPANEQTWINEATNAVRCYCAACSAPPSTADNSDSPFLRMPREVRPIRSPLLLRSRQQ